jgi:hypothetical protein
MRVVTTQPWHVQDKETPHPEQTEIDQYMRNRGFLRAYDGAYIHESRDIVATDALPKNFVEDRNGILHPIDVILTEPGSEQHERLTNMARSQAQLDESVDAPSLPDLQFSRTPPLTQASWLEQSARAAGYDSTESLIQENKPLHDRLQAQWDAYHGTDAEKKRSQDNAINDIDNQLYGTSQHSPTPSRRTSPGHSRREARTRLEAAREDYRRSFGSSAPPTGSPTGGGAEARTTQRKRERAWLVDWAREHGLLIHTLPSAWKPGGPDDAGQMEHHVFHVGSRWVKVTSGTGEHFGLWPVSHQGEWDMRKEDASILNYLNGMANANRVFGDDMVIQGVLAERDGSVKLIISQPDIEGDFADTKFIGKAMAEMGFVQLEPPSSFYRPSDNTAVIDLHQENAARVGDLVLPFDVKVLHPTGTLRENLERATAEKKQKGK